MRPPSPDRDPEFAAHRLWIESIVATPSPQTALRRLESYVDLSSPTEHVLRGTRSFAARSLRSRNTLSSTLSNSRMPSDSTNNENIAARPSYVIPQHKSSQVLGEIANNNQAIRPITSRLRPSPTPSLKRKKAEAIVKAHGSPQHIRVTAGGRIVPSDQSPLCFPRFGYSAVKANGGLIKFAPNQPIGRAAQWTQTLQEGMQNGLVAQDTEGRLCQIVNGVIMPLTEVNGALRLHMPAPNLNITQTGFMNGSEVDDVSHQQRHIPQPSLPVPVVPSTTQQINALELEYSKFQHELRELDKTEVVHGKTMSKPAKEALVSKRRELVLSMDKVRRALKALKEAPQPKSESPSSPHYQHSARTSVSPAGHDVNNAQRSYSTMPFQGPGMHPMYGMPYMPTHSGINPSAPAAETGFQGAPFVMPPPGFFVQQPDFDGTNNWFPYPIYQDPTAQMNTPMFQGAEQHSDRSRMMQSDGHASANDLKSKSPQTSHALPLRDPDTKQVVNVKSLLNPTSPEYRPDLHDQGQHHHAHNAIKQRAGTPLSLEALQYNNMYSEQYQNPLATRDGSVSSSVSFALQRDENHQHKHNQQNLSAGKEHHATGKEQHDGHKKSANASPAHALDLYHQHHDPSPQSIAPPATPVDHSQLQHQHSHFAADRIPDRQLHNLSPKSKRTAAEYDQVSIQPSHDGASSFTRLRPTVNTGSSSAPTGATIDFSQRSYDWIEGYQAGLNRQAVPADRAGDFLNGYCSGLLKSKPAQQPQSATKNNENESAASSRSGTTDMISTQSEQRPPLEWKQNSTDCLKEAVDARKPSSQNPIQDSNSDLVAWQKYHQAMMAAGQDGLASFSIPERQDSMTRTMLDEAGNPQSQLPNITLQRQPGKGATVVSSSIEPNPLNVDDFRSSVFLKHLPALPNSAQSMKTHDFDTASRTGSALSSSSPIPNGSRRRIISPAEWRSGGSLAQVANMANTFFTNTQFDGQPSDNSQQPDTLPSTAKVPGSPFSNKGMSRFQEMSLDGVSPPSSPTALSPRLSPQLSPSVSPRTSPVRFSLRRSPSKDSLNKQHSPTRAKLGMLAERVGFKTSPDKTGVEQRSVSPQGNKPRWREIWKGGRKD